MLNLWCEHLLVHPSRLPGLRSTASLLYFACISFYTCTHTYQFARILICSVLHTQIHICGIICQYIDTIVDRYTLFQCLQHSYKFLSLSIYIQIFSDILLAQDTHEYTAHNDDIYIIYIYFCLKYLNIDTLVLIYSYLYTSISD